MSFTSARFATLYTKIKNGQKTVKSGVKYIRAIIKT